MELMSLAELAITVLYSREHSEHITAEETAQIKTNAYSFGCSFAEVEVDIAMCTAKLKKIINIHDCGKIINPALAEAQVHGGISMGIGYALSEIFNSCIYLAVWAEGKEIYTLEGLQEPNGQISDLQQAFIDETAVQCGFCILGFIMEATEILNSGRCYTRPELRKLLSGHLCRCTGYENILVAVEKTMKKRLGIK